MEWNEILTAIFLALGVLISLTGSLGLLRMPDFYTRLHTAGKSDSLAQTFILGGLIFVTDNWQVAVRLLMIILLLFFTAPTATHAITKAARLDGLKPWMKE